MFSVYALIDQRGDHVRYVGITDDIYKRFSQHLQCNESNLDKNEWIQGLKDENLMLIMRTLEVVETIEEAREREQHWIHFYLRKGANLLNIDISMSFSYEQFQAFFEAKPKERTPRIPVFSGHGGKKQKARRLLAKNPDIDSAALAKKLECSPSYARKILADLKA